MYINEENKDLNEKGTFIPVPEKFRKHFKEDKVSYTNLTTKKGRLEKTLTENPKDTETKQLLDWINKKLNTEIQKNGAPKRSRHLSGVGGTEMSVDGTKSNNFRERKPNKPDRVGEVLKIKESEIEKEIDNIRYLIKYMNNNKNII
jgi:ribosomal protein S15P/S13E